MTLVRVQIPESEYRLLRQKAAASGKPLAEIVRQALHAYLQKETVDRHDSFLHLFPLGESGRKGHRAAQDHDDELYGPKR
jgi:hypothetical protein